MKQRYGQQKLDNGGYRVAWFIPVEMLLSGTMLGLSPYLGVGWSILVVGIPALFCLPLLTNFHEWLSKPLRVQEIGLRSDLSIEELLALPQYSADIELDQQKEEVTEEGIAPLNPVSVRSFKARSAAGLLRRHRRPAPVL